LGSAQDDSDLAMTSAEDLRDKLQAIEDQIIRAHMFPALGIEDADHPVWFALENLLAWPWFSRLWVFQESILAKEIIVGCGSQWLNWKILLSLADELCNKYMAWLVQRRTRQNTMETGTRTGFAALLGIDFARRRSIQPMVYPSQICLVKHKVEHAKNLSIIYGAFLASCIRT
jgi:hypothetical protein